MLSCISELTVTGPKPMNPRLSLSLNPNPEFHRVVEFESKRVWKLLCELGHLELFWIITQQVLTYMM